VLKWRPGIFRGRSCGVRLDEAIKGRRSIRRFQQREVPEPVIRDLLDLARHAPSSMNGQPWRFVVVRDEKTKKKIAAIKNKYCPPVKQAFRADFLQSAPVIIVICVERKKSFEREVENAVLAAAFLLLAAYSRGLGTVYMSAYRTGEKGIEEEFRQALGIPDGVDPVTMIPLGYPDEVPGSKDLVSLDEVVFFEAFGDQ
jgi:nitroreductase